MSKPILGYWNVRGLCHPIRFLLAYLGIEYEEKLYSAEIPPFKDWFDEKYTLGLQFPNIPYWIDGDVKLTECRAILKHIARENGKYLLPDPEDFETTTLADMLESITGEMMHSLLLVHCWRMSDEGEKLRLRGNFKAKLKEFSEFLGDKQWILGEKMTYVDFPLYETLYLHSTFDKQCILPYENLDKYMKRFESLPAITEYMNSPRFIKGPCNSPVANHPF